MVHILREHGYIPLEAASGVEAVARCAKEMPSAVLLDLMMPDIDGLEVMKRLRRECAGIPVIMVTGHGDVQSAVKAMKLGAYDFVTKPADIERLLVILQRTIEKVELEREVQRLNTSAETSLEWMLGRSEPIRRIVQLIQQVARTDFTVVLEGETGVGKSFIAGIIHSLSGRAQRSLVRIDMASIPETLIESELFGFEKGAFTGAISQKKGVFEKADGGTLFIDELQNMSPIVQTKFLSVLEERSVRHLGGSAQIPTDIRVIAATNRDMKLALKEQTFRKDLYYRLSEFVMTVPPLRERNEDIPFLAQKFLAEACADLQRPEMTISDEAAVFLMQFPWPGNVRELRNAVRRAALTAEDIVLNPRDLQYLIADQENVSGGNDSAALLPLKELTAIAVRDVERKAVQRAMAASGGNKTRAASILQVDFKTLQSKLRDYSIQ